MVALQLALFFCVALGLLCLLGYTPARLLLRDDLARWRLPFLPLLGLCVVVISSSFLNYVLPMRPITWLLIVAALIINAAIILRTRTLGLTRPARTEIGVLVCMIVAFGLGVAPLIHADTTTFLGLQWDLEFYLPLSEYLKRYPMGGPLVTYPSPLLEGVNSVPVRGGSGWGFSYFDAFVGTALGWDSYLTFRPTLQFLFALAVPAVYVFCRGALNMTAMPALLAAALSSVNGLNLWIASIGLGGHVVTFSTLPLALTTTIWAVRQPRRSTSLLAGVVVATLLLSFYTGAVATYALSMGLWGVVYLIRSTHRVAVIQSALAVIVAVLAFGAIAHLRFLELLPLYAQFGFSGGWQVTDFSPISQALGLSPFALITERIGELTPAGLEPDIAGWWARVLGWGGIALCLLAIWKGKWDRSTLVPVAIVFIVFALYMRYVNPYPYGHFKLLSLGAFLLLAALAQGMATLWELTSRPTALRAGPGAALESDITPMAARSNTLPRFLSLERSGTMLRRALVLYVTLFLPLLAFNTALSLRYFWEPDPSELPHSVWELRALHDHVPPATPVLMSTRSGFDPRLAAMAAYFLMDNPIVGDVKTAYGQAKNTRPDEAYQYVLLQAGERADARGLSTDDLVWRNDVVALYKRPERWLADIDLESVQQPVQFGKSTTVSLALDGNRWTLSGGPTPFEGALPSSSGPLQAELTLLTFEKTKATLLSGGRTSIVDVPAGLVTYRTAPMPAGGSIDLALPEASRPAWLLDVRIQQPQDASASIVALPDVFALQPSLKLDATQATLSLDYNVSDTRGGYMSLAAELYGQNPRGGLEPHGFWRLRHVTQPGNGQAQFILDLSGWRCGDIPTSLFPATEALEDGKYQLHLANYYVNEEESRLRLLDFTVRQGKVVEQQTQPMSSYFVQFLPIPRDVQALGKALPQGSTIYIPTPLDPDRSFLPVAAASLSQYKFYTTSQQAGKGTIAASPQTRYDYVALSNKADTGQWGTQPGPVWANDQAAFYPLNQQRALPTVDIGGQPVPVDGGATLSLEGVSTISGNSIDVEMRLMGERRAGTVVGIDIYGETACALQHYGWWGTSLPDAPEALRFSLDAPRQQGTLRSSTGASLTPVTQQLPIEDGTFRAFLFYKDGDRYETAPVLEFTLTNGQVTNFRPFPQVLRVGLDNPAAAR